MIMSTLHILSILSDFFVINSKINYYLIVEIISILIVVVWQVKITLKTHTNIVEFGKIFDQQFVVKNGLIHREKLGKESDSLEDIIFAELSEHDTKVINPNKDYVQISITETFGKGIIKQISDDINKYLLNNYGAPVNFSIIKDIIDREVDAKDERISNTISTPLYLGLAAAMLGIIIGLFSIPSIEGDHFSSGINALVDGVKVAMIGSLIGLSCTVILSSHFYKREKDKVLRKKNRLITHIQKKLLPELLKAEESGLTGLKTSIDKFSRDTVSLANNLYQTSIKTEENLKVQYEIIERVEQMNILKVSKANIELFDKFDKNVYAFNKFSEYLELMGQISNQLKDFAQRTSVIDTVAEHIGSTLTDNRQLIEFLSSHFQKIEDAGGAALNAVNYADSHFKEAIRLLRFTTQETIDNSFNTINNTSSQFADALSKLINEIEVRTTQININAASHETKLTDIYNEIGIKLKFIIDTYLEDLNNILRESSPNFNELNHLTELPIIKEQIANINSLYGNKIVNHISQLENLLKKISENFKQPKATVKLSSTEERLTKKRKGEPKETEIKPFEVVHPNLENAPISLFAIIKRLIKRHSNEE